MKRINLCFVSLVLMILSCAIVSAQRPRITDPPKPDDKTNTQEQKEKNTTQENKDAKTDSSQQENKTATTTPAPQNVKVKYEGGVFGYRQKMDGFLFFDDANSRLVFKDKQQKEIFQIPYDAISAAFADTQARTPTAATVIGSSVPYGLGLPALFIKKKYRYLTMQYNDNDVNVAGMTSFKMENKAILEQTLKALADKAKLTPKGEIYIRRRVNTNTNNTGSSPFVGNR